MPSTINGVGTRYYGKRNVLTRPGTCPFCKRQVNLSSYDTRLWFVVVFIPVIPLARKRIIDSCPACRRLYVTNLQKWETTKQLEISGALEKYRNNPSAETAIDAHRQLTGFHQLGEAADLQKLMCQQYPDNAKVFAYLAQSLTQYGRTTEADPMFARALELRPDLPEARIGVALTYIRAGRLDEARRLLDFMEKPGAAQLYPLSPLEKLALAYQKAGRHQEALDLFGRLLAELPAIGQHKGFRKNVKKSEDALKKSPSILPKYQFSFKKLFAGGGGAESGGRRSVSTRTALIIVGCVLVLTVMGFMLANEYMRRHRTVYVANQFGPDLRLDIGGIGPVRLTHGVNAITLPEGRYHASFSGAVTEEDDFEIRSGYWQRWSASPAWVLNPGGAAILVYQRAVYSHTPRPGYANYHFGRRFEIYPEITHPFEDLPPTVTVDSGTSERVLTSVQFFLAKPVNAVYALEQDRRESEAADVAEWALGADPDNGELLGVYLQLPLGQEGLRRRQVFLGTGLTNRPVEIEWHRAYQGLFAEGPGWDELEGRYEKLLAAEPTNSALMYLLGRVCADRARANDLFARSHETDATDPFPLYALGYDRMLTGNWAEAKPLLEQAKALRPADPQFRDEWRLACRGLKQYDEAEADLRAQLKEQPTGLMLTMELCEVLAAEGKRGEAEQAIADLVRAYVAAAPDNARLVEAVAQRHLLYAVGDFTALENAARLDSKTAGGKLALFRALIEQNKLDDAARVLPASDNMAFEDLLGMTLAFRLAGRTNDARTWQEVMIGDYRSGNTMMRLEANLLDGKAAPTEDALDGLNMSVPMKAVFVANLAVAHPEERERLNAVARTLNVGRNFPHYLIERATAVSP